MIKEMFKFIPQCFKPVNVSIKIDNESYYKLRPLQQEAFDLLKNEKYRTLNMPTGSGKSWLMCALTAEDLKNNPTYKAIIAVPQRDIAKGFTKCKLEIPYKLNWHPVNNLCDRSPTDGTIDTLIKFLSNKHDPDYKIANDLIDSGYLEYVPFKNDADIMHVQLSEKTIGLINNYYTLEIINDYKTIYYEKFETIDDADKAFYIERDKCHFQQLQAIIIYLQRPSMKLCKKIHTNSIFIKQNT